MNLEGKSRCKLMRAVAVFAYTLSIHEGLKEYKKVPVKKYANGPKTKAYSVFRNGLDRISAFCYNLTRFCSYLIENMITKLPAYKSKFAIFICLVVWQYILKGKWVERCVRRL